MRRIRVSTGAGCATGTRPTVTRTGFLALHLGVTGIEAFDAQDRAVREGRALTLADAIREVHERKARGAS